MTVVYKQIIDSKMPPTKREDSENNLSKKEIYLGQFLDYITTQEESSQKIIQTLIIENSTQSRETLSRYAIEFNNLLKKEQRKNSKIQTKIDFNDVFFKIQNQNQVINAEYSEISGVEVVDVPPNFGYRTFSTIFRLLKSLGLQEGEGFVAGFSPTNQFKLYFDLVGENSIVVVDLIVGGKVWIINRSKYFAEKNIKQREPLNNIIDNLDVDHFPNDYSTRIDTEDFWKEPFLKNILKNKTDAAFALNNDLVEQREGVVKSKKTLKSSETKTNGIALFTKEVGTPQEYKVVIEGVQKPYKTIEIENGSQIYVRPSWYYSKKGIVKRGGRNIPSIQQKRIILDKLIGENNIELRIDTEKEKSKYYYPIEIIHSFVMQIECFSAETKHIDWSGFLEWKEGLPSL